MLLPDLSPAFKDTSFFFSDENQKVLMESGGDELPEPPDFHTPLTGSPATMPRHTYSSSQSLSHAGSCTPSPPRYFDDYDHKQYDGSGAAGGGEPVTLADKRKSWFEQNDSNSGTSQNADDTVEDSSSGVRMANGHVTQMTSC